MADQLKSGIIWNKTAGRPDARMRQIIADFAKHHETPLYETNNEKEGIKALKQCLDKNIDLLVLIGGDGTVRCTCSFLLEQLKAKQRPKLLILSGGTTNLIHQDLGYKVSDLQIISKVLQNAGSPPVRERSCLSVTLCAPHSPPKKTHGFFLGLGALPDITKKINKAPYQAGFRTRFLEALFFLRVIFALYFGNLQKHKFLYPHEMHISFDQANWHKKDYIFSYITSLEKLLFGFGAPAHREPFFMLYLKYPFQKFFHELNEYRKGRTPKGRALEISIPPADILSVKFEGRWVLDGTYHTLKKGQWLEVKLSEHLQFIDLRPFLKNQEKSV